MPSTIGSENNFKGKRDFSLCQTAFIEPKTIRKKAIKRSHKFPNSLRPKITETEIPLHQKVADSNVYTTALIRREI